MPTRFDPEEAALAAGWQQELMGGGRAPETEEYGVSSLSWTSPRPFHPLRLWRRMLEESALPPVLRSKVQKSLTRTFS
jgi:G3E family GTPase